MSLKRSINIHWHQFERKRETMAEALSWSVSGRNLQKESKYLAKTKIISNLMHALCDDNGNTIDRFKMSQYLAQCLDNNPEHNLRKFMMYLEVVSQRIDSPQRKKYYENLRDVLDNFIHSRELEEYLNICEDFRKDQSKEAVLAKHVMNELAVETQKIMGDY